MAVPRPQASSLAPPPVLPGHDGAGQTAPEQDYLAEVLRTAAELDYAAGILLQADREWPDFPGAVAASLMVENANRRWRERHAPDPALQAHHLRWLRTLRLLAESMPLYRRAIGSRDERLTADLLPSVRALFERTAAVSRGVARASGRRPQPGA